jgi:hypothetical protein
MLPSKEEILQSLDDAVVGHREEFGEEPVELTVGVVVVEVLGEKQLLEWADRSGVMVLYPDKVTR